MDFIDVQTPENYSQTVFMLSLWVIRRYLNIGKMQK